MTKHINLDTAYNLARALLNSEYLDDELKEAAEHVKDCKKCYESYSMSVAVQDLTSEEALREVYGADEKYYVSVFSVVKDKINKTITAVQDYAQDLSWRFSLQPAFAGARSIESDADEETNSETILQNEKSGFSKIIIRNNKIRALIEDDGDEYLLECEAENGEKYSAPFKYDKYEDMLVAELEQIPDSNYTLSISESDL